MRQFSKQVLDDVSEVALKHMNYEPETGVITWKPGRKWAKKKPGEPLGCSDGGKGYRVIYITTRGKYRQFRAHRLAWLIYYGSWPDGEIDHINHDKTDNRIENLRCVPLAINQQNRGKSSRNTSGYTGVHYCTRKRGWIAQYSLSSKKIQVGKFDSAEEANDAVIKARAEAGFHRNHGRD